jgi:hypothetical protein
MAQSPGGVYLRITTIPPPWGRESRQGIQPYRFPGFALHLPGTCVDSLQSHPSEAGSLLTGLARPGGLV